MCPVMADTEILAILKKYGLHGKNLHACIAECRGVTNCCWLQLLWLHGMLICS